MKKVIIIANLFHASPRIPGLVKYLPEFGWQPIILTTPIGEEPESRFGPPNDFKNNNRVIETDYLPVLGFWRKIFGFNPSEDIGLQAKNRFNITSEKSSYLLLSGIYKKAKAIIKYPDAEKGWKPFAVKAGRELLQKEDIDAIISSSSPVTSHIIAKELKIKYKIPWIADLRDLWTQNHSYPYGNIRKFFEQKLELKILQPADALVTVSSPLAEQLQTLHKGKAMYTITNGFDPDKMSKGQVDLTSKFTITYTGQIYTGREDPSKLLAALRDVLSDGIVNSDDVEVRFYGPDNELLAKEIKEYGLLDIVKQYGIVPREISFEKQRESQILLLLNWEDQRKRGVYTLKVFEYLAAQRPILAIGGSDDGVVKELLDETKAGRYAPTIEDIKSILRELYSEHKHKGKIDYSGDLQKINKYSYREMARKFAEVLNMAYLTYEHG
jgi:hypothetical protein